jgi:putative restriction endonuclease
MPFEIGNVERPIVTQVLQRPFRDRAFSVAIKSAYQDTYAVTGLKRINGGRAQAFGPRIFAPWRKADRIAFGMEWLAGTVHWIFDRGLIAVDDGYSLLIASDGVPHTITRLIKTERRLLVPARTEDRPHSQFLQYHRDKVFKG